MNEIRQLLNRMAMTEAVEVDVSPTSSRSMTSNVATGSRRPYFEELKEIANENSVYLINAFRAERENLQFKLQICEALQFRPSASLGEFFGELLNHEVEDMICCAAMGVAKAGSEAYIERLRQLLSGEQSRRLRYYVGLALLLLRDRHGIDCLIDVLDSEKQIVNFRNGRIFIATTTEIFCVRISLAFGAVSGEVQPDIDPFEWIESKGELYKALQEFDMNAIPENLRQYYPAV